ncbi:MAG: hypothetical protein JOZ27_04335 [Caulobacteraceae bacterium]|nr:hypothetical protein [Caulobacteraceae bacterium]
MTPALPDILIGQVVALNAPLPPESAGDFMVARLGLVALLSTLAAQEAERGPAARVWENEAIAAVLARAGKEPAPAVADDLSWSGLDARNAELRGALIHVHERAERDGDAALDREILRLYAAMAKARRLEPPGFA